MRGFSAYQTLLTSDISERLRRDEVQFEQNTAQRLAAALKRRGVAEKVLQEAMREVAQSDRTLTGIGPINRPPMRWL